MVHPDSEYERHERPEEGNRAHPPGQKDNQSMPSSAASEAFNYTTLSNRNIDDIPISRTHEGPDAGREHRCRFRRRLGRVEAGGHYPSDVLAGAALGHFLTAFICKALWVFPRAAHVVVRSL